MSRRTDVLVTSGLLPGRHLRRLKVGDRREYYRRWWEKNKEKVLQRRRERYAEDSGYREQIAEASKRSKKKRRQEKREFLGDRRRKVRLPRVKEPVEIEWRGKRVLGYGVDILCRVLGRSRSTVFSWERMEWMPRTPLADKNGDKLYTAGMIMVVKEVADANRDEGLSRGKRVFSGGNAMYSRIQLGWDSLTGDEEFDEDVLSGGMVRVPPVVTVKALLRGKPTLFYTVDTLVRSVGRSKYCVLGWEKSGLLPRTPFRDVRRWRLYTLEMITVVGTVIGQYEVGDIDRGAVYEKIVSGWRACGVSGQSEQLVTRISEY
jgi:hypothetical protein